MDVSLMWIRFWFLLFFYSRRDSGANQSLSAVNNIVLDGNEEWIFIPSPTSIIQIQFSSRWHWLWLLLLFKLHLSFFFTRHLEPFERIKERGFVSAPRRDSEDSLLTAELLAERMFVPVGHPATVPAKFAQLLPDDWLTRPRREEEEVQHGLASWRSISSSLQSLSSSFHDDSWPLCVCMFCPCLSGFSSGSLKSCIWY